MFTTTLCSSLFQVCLLLLRWIEHLSSFLPFSATSRVCSYQYLRLAKHDNNFPVFSTWALSSTIGDLYGNRSAFVAVWSIAKYLHLRNLINTHPGSPVLQGFGRSFSALHKHYKSLASIIHHIILLGVKFFKHTDVWWHFFYPSSSLRKKWRRM